MNENEDNENKKLLLMGRYKVGKTAMHLVIFSNYLSKETKNIGFTNDINESRIKFLGLNLNIKDCGGQDELINQYIKSFPDRVFTKAETLLYVFDISSETKEEDLEFFQLIVQKLLEFSPNAKIFVLIHKMDLIDPNLQEKTFENFKAKIIEKSSLLKDNIDDYFPTSIYNESLYNAWSKIVQIMIPNWDYINKSLENFCNISACDEIILLEKLSFLIISYYEKKETKSNLQKYERISTIIKYFKLSCKYFN